MAKQNAISNSAYVIGSETTVTAATNLVATAGNLLLPTTSSTVGQIQINSNPVFHTYGSVTNLFVGDSSGNFTLDGAHANSNTGVGYITLLSLTGTANGYNNTAIGAYCGDAITDGLSNTLLGHYCGRTITTGEGNTLVGQNCGASLGAASKWNIYIGRAIAGGTEDSTLRIGKATGTGESEINVAVICGITGKTSTSGAAVYCNSSNVLGTSTSNRDSKEDISDMGSSSSVVYKLRPRTFKFKADSSPKRTQFGMIAEEVEEVFPEMVLYDEENKPWNLAYQFLAPMLVNEIQKLNKRIELLEDQLKLRDF